MEEGERGVGLSTRNDNSMAIINPLEKGGHGTSFFLDLAHWVHWVVGVC